MFFTFRALIAFKTAITITPVSYTHLPVITSKDGFIYVINY